MRREEEQHLTRYSAGYPDPNAAKQPSHHDSRGRKRTPQVMVLTGQESQSR